MTTRVRPITGFSTSAETFGVGGTDLGIPRMLPNGRIGYFFGDTWLTQGVGGADWRSPVLLYSDDIGLPALDAGIDFHGAANRPAANPNPDYATQLWDYNHDAYPWTNGGFSTVLPADALVIGNRTYLFAMVNKGFPSVAWTEIAYSDDSGATWNNGGPNATKPGNWMSDRQQCITWEYDEVTGYVYILSSGFQRDKNVHLYRVPVADLLNRNAWQGWGWNGANWGWNRPASDILPAGSKVGEMCLRKIENNWVFMYFDANNARIVAKVLDSPIGNMHTAPTHVLVKNCAWSMANIDLHNTLSQPYGGYIVPGSTMANLHFVVSQWNTTPGANNLPYRAVQFKTSLPKVVG